jgi:2-dehydro-3-deoxyglucarate aldolase
VERPGDAQAAARYRLLQLPDSVRGIGRRSPSCRARHALPARRHPRRLRRAAQNRYGTLPDFFKTINDNICVLVQIESRKGVEAADEICAEPGVDGIFIGPNDLAAAYGHLGNPNHPEVQAAVRQIYEAANRAGKAIGTLTPVEADARRYLDMGAHFVAVGIDNALLRDAARVARALYRVNPFNRIST